MRAHDNDIAAGVMTCGDYRKSPTALRKPQKADQRPEADGIRGPDSQADSPWSKRATSQREREIGRLTGRRDSKGGNLGILHWRPPSRSSSKSSSGDDLILSRFRNDPAAQRSAGTLITTLTGTRTTSHEVSSLGSSRVDGEELDGVDRGNTVHGPRFRRRATGRQADEMKPFPGSVHTGSTSSRAGHTSGPGFALVIKSVAIQSAWHCRRDEVTHTHTHVFSVVYVIICS